MCLMTDRKIALKAFIEALKECLDFDFNVSKFDHRLKMQKLVYLAKVMGVPNLNYDYSLYLRGPYSQALADDYYDLSHEKNLDSIAEETQKIMKNEAFKRFSELVKDKDGTWLEVATTTVELNKSIKRLVKAHIIDEKDRYNVLKKLIKNRKPFASRNLIEEIVGELKENNLI